MLKIGKKEELKAEGVSNVYAAEEKTEQAVLKAIREKSYIDWQHIQSLLNPLPSLPAPIIAEILQKTLTTLQEDGIQTALDGILQLVAFPHDSRELRHCLKSQFRIDGELLLYLLWQRREAAGAVYLAEVVADCCTAQLMLSGSGVIVLWKRHLAATAAFLRSKERLAGRLEQGAGGQTTGSHGFRRVIIPL